MLLFSYLNQNVITYPIVFIPLFRNTSMSYNQANSWTYVVRSSKHFFIHQMFFYLVTRLFMLLLDRILQPYWTLQELEGIIFSWNIFMCITMLSHNSHHQSVLNFIHSQGKQENFSNNIHGSLLDSLILITEAWRSEIWYPSLLSSTLLRWPTQHSNPCLCFPIPSWGTTVHCTFLVSLRESTWSRDTPRSQAMQYLPWGQPYPIRRERPLLSRTPRLQRGPWTLTATILGTVCCSCLCIQTPCCRRLALRKSGMS